MKDVLRDKFNKGYRGENPPEGHLERFTDMLDNQLYKPVFSNKVLLAYAAAVAVIVVILSIALNNDESKTFTTTILSMEDIEMIETEQYFQSEIDKRIAVIKKMEEDNKSNMLNDIKEFDSSLKKLLVDYQQTPGDDRIVNAVLTTYLMKIEALDKIMNILQKHS
jgi:hypothetical protein